MKNRIAGKPGRSRGPDEFTFPSDLHAIAPAGGEAGPACGDGPDSAWLGLLRHELKTPLAGMLGLAHRIDRDALAPDQNVLIDALIASGRHLAALVERLIPRPETGGESGQCTAGEVDGHRLLEAIVQAHWSGALRRGIGLYLQVQPGLARRWLVDASRLRQILDNLIDNAIDATASGHVLLRARSARRPVNGRFTVELIVEDTGTGCDSVLGSRLYEWGIRTPSGETRRDYGSGIGLFVCRWLAAELGGRIKYVRRPGGGTLFTLILPVAPGTAPLSATRIRSVIHRNLRCQVVLPEPVGSVVESILQGLGIRARRAPQPQFRRLRPGHEAVVCEPRWLNDQTDACVSACEPVRPILVFQSGVRSGAGPASAQSRLQFRCLPEPLTPGSLEPLLLEVGLASAPGESTGRDPGGQ